VQQETSLPSPEEMIDSFEKLDEPQLMQHLRKWFMTTFGISTYRAWFANVMFVNFVESTLVLGVNSNHWKAKLEINYVARMREFLAEQCLKPLQVEVLVEPSHSKSHHQGETISTNNSLRPRVQHDSSKSKERTPM
jgi:chromosomal replication initiation ATPase DnaA